MSQKKLSEYIDALDGITYPQWVKLREGIDMQFDFSRRELVVPESVWLEVCAFFLMLLCTAGNGYFLYVHWKHME